MFWQWNTAWSKITLQGKNKGLEAQNRVENVSGGDAGSLRFSQKSIWKSLHSALKGSIGSVQQ